MCGNGTVTDRRAEGGEGEGQGGRGTCARRFFGAHAHDEPTHARAVAPVLADNSVYVTAFIERRRLKCNHHCALATGPPVTSPRRPQAQPGSRKAVPSRASRWGAGRDDTRRQFSHHAHFTNFCPWVCGSRISDFYSSQTASWYDLTRRPAVDPLRTPASQNASGGQGRGYTIFSYQRARFCAHVNSFCFSL